MVQLFRNRYTSEGKIMKLRKIFKKGKKCKIIRGDIETQFPEE